MRLAKGCVALAAVLVAAAFVTTFLAFGGRAIGWSVIACAGACAAAAALLFAADALAGARPPGRLVAGAAVGLLAVAVAGLVALPAGVVGALSPVRLAVQQALPPDLHDWPRLVAEDGGLRLDDVLADDPAADEGGERAGEARTVEAVALSFDPGRTRVASVVLASFLAVLLALSARRDAHVGLRLLAVVLLVAAAGAAYGVWGWRTGQTRIYGIFEHPPNAVHRPFGTFWNQNHAAALLAMLAPAGLGLAASRSASLLLRLAGLLALPLLLAGVVVAASRGGILSAGMGLALMGLLLRRGTEARPAGLALVLGALAATVAAFTVAGARVFGQGLEELTAVEGVAYRLQVYRTQLGMLAGSPLLGTGVGAFFTAHGPFDRTADTTVPLHGEGDWFEVLAEGGLAFAVLWLVLAAALLVPALRAIRAGRAPAWACGLVAGSLATLAHAAVDFHHRSCAVSLATVLLASTAHAWARSLDPPAPGTRSRSRLPLVLALLAAALAACTALEARRLVPHDVAVRAAERALERRDAEGLVASARHAADAAPEQVAGWALLSAGHEMRARLAPPPQRPVHRVAAMEASVTALELTPAALGAARRAGQLLLEAGRPDAARRATRLALLVSGPSPPTLELAARVELALGEDERALEHLAAAYAGLRPQDIAAHGPRLSRLVRELAGDDPERVLRLLPATAQRYSYVYELHARGHDAEIPGFLGILARQQEFEAPEALLVTALHVPSPEGARLARRLLPFLDAPHARLRAARVLLQGGDAGRARRIAAGVAARPDAPPEAFAVLSDVALSEGRLEEALSVLEEGRRRHPEDADLGGRLDYVRRRLRP